MLTGSRDNLPPVVTLARKLLEGLIREPLCKFFTNPTFISRTTELVNVCPSQIGLVATINDPDANPTLGKLNGKDA